MSAVRTGIPPLIEQQLLALDKQIRDASFIRGAARTLLGVCLFLGCGLLLDGMFALNNTARECLLAGWFVLAIGLLWRGVVRIAIAPVSLASLAALIEQQFPELRERLTSLVELRGNDGTELAPGASKLMQDLLARQTVKALDKLSIESVASNHGPLRSVLAGAASLLLLVAPFAWNGDGYGLLWSRFFVPWGNFAWGTHLDLKVTETDQVVARGSDVPIHVTLTNRRHHREIEKNSVDPLWLNWRDETLASDRRRLDWDEETKTFLTTLPRVQRSVSFDVTTNGAKSGTCRIDVADPPVITQFNIEIEPAAYTGLPAKSLAGVPAEIRVPEFSRIQLQVVFREPVIEAELLWPVESSDAPKTPVQPEKRHAVEQAIPIELSTDRCSGTVTVTASLSGPFVVRASNSFGLRNHDPTRTLVVALDQPPELKLSGSDEPVLVRPDDVFEQPIEVHEDFGLTAVELHLETSTGVKHLKQLTGEQHRDLDLSHTFKVDLTPFALSGGQVVTYRIRAVDNRPQPSPQEVWSATRTLMVNTSLKQIPDRELAAETNSLEVEVNSLRTELNESKQDLVNLHEQIEKESLNRQPETDKNDRLTELQQAQDKLIERLQQLSDRLAERPMTQDLAPMADRIADENLTVANEKLEQSKNQTPRDQLEPVAQAIDRNGSADRQLQQLERHLNELSKLEQDLAELNRMAQHAERVADQLDKLDGELLAAADKKSEASQTQLAEKSAQKIGTDKAKENPATTSGKSRAADSQGRDPAHTQTNANANPETASTLPKEDPKDAETLQKLKDEGKKLADQMSELLKKHPELVEAARREQQDQLNRLADQARQLAEPQERLAAALKQTAENGPAVASRPENATPPASDEPHKSDVESTSTSDEKPNDPRSVPNEKQTPESNLSDSPKGDSPKGDSPKGDSSEKPTPQQQGSTAAQKQEQIAREATQQALDLAREVGADAPATRAATESARKADSARQQAQSGKLADAAKEAREAEKASDETRKQLNPDGQSSSPQLKRSQELSDKQRENAKQLEQLAKSPEAARGAQLEGQKQLADATQNVADQLDQAVKKLRSAPLNSAQSAESGERAKAAAKQAEKAMKKSEEANQQNDPEKSAEEAAKAAENLKRAANEIKLTPPQSPQSTPVPKRMASQVAEAMKRATSAQEKLTECNCSNPSETGKRGSKPGSNSSEPKSNSQPDSKGQSGEQSKPEKPSESDGKQPGESQQEGKSQGPNSKPDSQSKKPEGTSKEGESKGGEGIGPNQKQVNESQIAQAAEQFRDLAAMLRQVRAEPKENLVPGKPLKSQRPGKPIPSESTAKSEPNESGGNAAGTTSVPDLSHLESELQQRARSNWGRLPGQLRTEILQGAGKKSHPEYTQRIKSYFDEITKPAK